MLRTMQAAVVIEFGKPFVGTFLLVKAEACGVRVPLLKQLDLRVSPGNPPREKPLPKRRILCATHRA
jgi:hypothetical protein